MFFFCARCEKMSKDVPLSHSQPDRWFRVILKKNGSARKRTVLVCPQCHAFLTAAGDKKPR